MRTRDVARPRRALAASAGALLAVGALLATQGPGVTGATWSDSETRDSAASSGTVLLTPMDGAVKEVRLSATGTATGVAAAPLDLTHDGSLRADLGAVLDLAPGRAGGCSAGGRGAAAPLLELSVVPAGAPPRWHLVCEWGTVPVPVVSGVDPGPLRLDISVRETRARGTCPPHSPPDLGTLTLVAHATGSVPAAYGDDVSFHLVLDPSSAAPDNGCAGVVSPRLASAGNGGAGGVAVTQEPVGDPLASLTAAPSPLLGALTYARPAAGPSPVPPEPSDAPSAPQPSTDALEPAATDDAVQPTASVPADTPEATPAGSPASAPADSQVDAADR